jgi:CMP-N,N'-diacetyllegionaminic acid synthase
MKILVVVAARGGSKGLPEKNLRRDGTVLVDTDSEEIAEEGRRWGATVPFLRPARLAGDEARMIDNVLHALDRIAEERGEHDTVVLLQPTSPLRDVEDVLACFRAFDSAIAAGTRLSEDVFG